MTDTNLRAFFRQAFHKTKLALSCFQQKKEEPITYKHSDQVKSREHKRECEYIIITMLIISFLPIIVLSNYISIVF